MILELLNGTRYDTDDYNLKRLFHFIPSTNIEHTNVSIDGRNDVIVNSKLNNRVISVEFIYQSRDIFDFYAIRDKVNALFLRDEDFYIIFKKEPHKRWRVRTSNQFQLPPNMRIESFTVEFVTQNLYAESIATTQSLKEWDINVWSWDSNITWDDNLNYSFNTNDFTINNLGNAIVDPRRSFLEINLKGDFETGVTIRNLNLGSNQDFVYNSPISPTDTLTLSGIRTLRNGVSDLRNSNKRLITLQEGANRFSVFGGTVSNIDFNFRFLYK